MNIPKEEWDLIETYLDNPDGLEKTISFKDKLNGITNIEEKIRYVKKFRKDIENSIIQSKIKEFHQHFPDTNTADSLSKQETKKSKSFNRRYAMAAVLIVSLGLFWIIKDQNPSEKIFAEHFKPDIGLPLRMGAENSYGFYEGMLDYKQGKYLDATNKWKILLEKNPENDTLNYFLGVANLALGNAPKSLEYLENQELYNKSIFKEDVAYYAALAKIKEGKFNEAKDFLKNHPSVRNTNLLKELEKQ